MEKVVGSRRADALWEAKKVVFEVQISPISYEEAFNRSRDYAEAGYQIVWLLHETHFNHTKASLAERFLRKTYPTYYTNGAFVYDQFEVWDGKIRSFKGEPLPIDLTSPIKPFLPIPHRTWPLHFIGDLHTWCAQYGVKTLEKLHRKHAPLHTLAYWLKFLEYRLLELIRNS